MGGEMTPDERKLCNGSEYGQVGERRFTLFENDIATMAVELDLLYVGRRFFILDEIEPLGDDIGRAPANLRPEELKSLRVLVELSADPPGDLGSKGVSTHNANGRNVGWLKLKERARGRRW